MKKKYKLKFVRKTGFVNIYKVVLTDDNDLNGIVANSFNKALSVFKRGYPDEIILPVTLDELKKSLKNIELYYIYFIKAKELNLKNEFNKIRFILMKNNIIDKDNNLLINFDIDLKRLRNKKREEIVINAKNVKKEFSFYDIFSKLNYCD